jgi:leukotriene-A4 hydrolase
VLPEKVTAAQMKELDEALGLTKRTNAEVLFQWLLLSVRHRYEPAYLRLEEFLTSQGRRKFLKPLYEDLVKTPEGRKRAQRIYEKARPTYHPIAVATVDALLKGK